MAYGSIASKANLYVSGFRRFTKNHQYKVEDRLTQTLVFPEIHGASIVSLLNNIMLESAVTELSLCQRQRL